MSESVAAERADFAAAAGPDTLRIPAEPTQLSQAVQQLRSIQPAGDIVREVVADAESILRALSAET